MPTPDEIASSPAAPRNIDHWLDQCCASFETAASRLPQDEDRFLIVSIIYLMLRSAQRARLEARTALLRPSHMVACLGVNASDGTELAASRIGGSAAVAQSGGEAIDCQVNAGDDILARFAGTIPFQ